MSDGPLFLVADVGGTNTRVAMARGRHVLPETITRYRNRDFSDLSPVLRQYRTEHGGPAPDGACVAVAGPVADGIAALTNLDWSIDIDRLRQATDANRGAIVNDLQAQGHALGYLTADAYQTIINAPKLAGGTRLVIGVGTGFNAAPVHDTAAGRLVPPSESGHANLPIRTEADLRLCHFVSSAHNFPAIEDVLSGRGFEQLYRWLAQEEGVDASPDAAQIMATLDQDARARRAVSHFVRLLGAVAGNLALVHLPVGGIYLVGGVSQHMAPYLQGPEFKSAFCDKGRFAEFLSSFPVSLVTDDFAALTGCAAVLAEVTS